MPSVYEATIESQLPEAQLVEAVTAACEAIISVDPGFRLIQGPGKLTQLRVRGRIRSWGQKVSIGVIEGGIRIASETRAPWELTDWGRNRRNAEGMRRLILKAIDGSLASEST